MRKKIGFLVHSPCSRKRHNCLTSILGALQIYFLGEVEEDTVLPSWSLKSLSEEEKQIARNRHCEKSIGRINMWEASCILLGLGVYGRCHIKFH